MRHQFKVVDTFSLENFGLVVVADAKSKEVNVIVDEMIEVVRPDGSSFKTKVAGIQMISPYDPERRFSFSLPKGIRKEDIPIGTEIWIDQAEA